MIFWSELLFNRGFADTFKTVFAKNEIHRFTSGNETAYFFFFFFMFPVLKKSKKEKIDI